MLWLSVALITSLLAFSSCSHHTVRGRDGKGNGDENGNDGRITNVTLHERADWSIKYIDREDYTEDDGYISRVEKFQVYCPGVTYYILLSISPDDLKELYNNDPLAFFQKEAEYYRSDAEYYNEKVTDYFYTADAQDYLLDRMRMGTWNMYLVAMNASGYATGDYAKTTFTLKEEEPIEDYSKWLGEWTVTGKTYPDEKGNTENVSYVLTVEKEEANLSYDVRGWETGESIKAKEGTVMDQEYLVTEFDWSNHNMYFRSQYLGTYTDDTVGKDVDELFLGKVDYKGTSTADHGIWIISDENLDLGAAVATDKGIEISGCDVYVTISTKEELTTFAIMQYIRAFMNGQDVDYLEYNTNVPTYPLTMVKTKASVSRPALVRRPVTKASVHHSQTREHRDRRSQSAKSAVRVK